MTACPIRMEFDKLTTQSTELLHTALAEQRRQLSQLRFQVADGTSKNVRQLRSVRRQVAKILTALRQRQGRRVPHPDLPAADAAARANQPT